MSDWPIERTDEQELFEEQMFRLLFPRRHRIIEAARRLASSADPTNYMYMSPRVRNGVPDGLVVALNEAGEARSELCEAVGQVPRFVPRG